MKQAIKDLLTLQAEDLRIRELKTRLASIPAERAKLVAEFEVVRRALEKAKRNKLEVEQAIKQQAAATAQVAAKIAGATSIEEVAERLGVAVDHRDALSLGSTNVEPALIGAISAAKQGEIYGPVAGIMGTYVVRVANKEVGTFYSEADAKNLALQKAQYLSQMIPSVMQEYDDVKDNRERFF